MQDKIGVLVPTAKEIEKNVGQVEAIGSAEYFYIYSADGRQRTTKFRPGGESIVGLLGALATKYGVILPRISVEAMNADLERSQRLQPLDLAVKTLSLSVDDTILKSRSDCWWAATAYYTTLSRMSAMDPELAAALRPAVEFFATGPRSPKTPAGTPTK